MHIEAGGPGRKQCAKDWFFELFLASRQTCFLLRFRAVIRKFYYFPMNGTAPFLHINGRYLSSCVCPRHKMNFILLAMLQNVFADLIALNRLGNHINIHESRQIFSRHSLLSSMITHITKTNKGRNTMKKIMKKYFTSSVQSKSRLNAFIENHRRKKIDM